MPNPARPTWPTNCEQLTNSIPSHTGTPGKKTSQKLKWSSVQKHPDLVIWFCIFRYNKSPRQTGRGAKFSHHYASQWQLHKAHQLVKYAAAYIALRNQWTNEEIVKYAAVSRQFVLLVD